jgi:hypothetical protein
MATKITIGEVRFSYPNLFVARAMEVGGKEKFSVSVIIPKKDKKTIAAVEASIAEAMAAGKAKNGTAWKGSSPLIDGDGQDKNGNAYGAEFHGSYFLRCNSDNKPIVIDRARQAITDPRAVYAGSYGNVNVNFYPYNHTVNKGVAAGLNAVQFVKDGEPLGGGYSAAQVDSDFDELPPLEIDEDGMFD